MTAKEIVREVIARSGIPQTALSKKLGYSNKTAVGAILNKNNSLRADVLCKWLEVLGFEIVIRRKDGKGKEWIMTAESDAAEIDSAQLASIRSEMKPPERK